MHFDIIKYQSVFSFLFRNSNVGYFSDTTTGINLSTRISSYLESSLVAGQLFFLGGIGSVPSVKGWRRQLGKVLESLLNQKKKKKEKTKSWEIRFSILRRDTL